MRNSITNKLADIESRLGIELHRHQRQSLTALSEGKNVILHSPTGSGKTIVFQESPNVVPGDGITVILYPLRALVKDQTRRFNELGLEIATLYGETKTKDRPAILDDITSGRAKLLLTTPESFDKNLRLQSALTLRGVSLLVVDEAHAYEEWADGFRPTYRNAGRVADRIGAKQFLLCSATLTAKGYKSACSYLNRHDWAIVQVPPQRPNLIYKNLSEPSSEILTRAVRGDGLEAPGIVFFTTIKCLNETADLIERRTGKKILRYHGSLTPRSRKLSQEAWMDGKEWIFATKAFGMGVDKDDVRTIIHMQLPSSVLSYAQEAGRAGRDGKESYCLLTRTERGNSAEFLLDMTLPSVETVYKVWKALKDVALNTADEWFTVDWNRIALQTNLWQQTLRGAVSWLFTAKMMEKRSKDVSWKFMFYDDTDERAAAYKYKAPDVVECLRGEAMLDDTGGFRMRQEELEDSVGLLVNNWRNKLRTMAEKEIFFMEEPEQAASTYRFIEEGFEFDDCKQRLIDARRNAFDRLNQMRRLQMADAGDRRVLIEDAISLDVSELDGVESVEILDADDTEYRHYSVKTLSKNKNDDEFEEGSLSF